jgi:manganese/iron transport system permease protein
MQNAILAGLLVGVSCGIIGVFVVLLRMPFIGVCMAHAAFAGALLGLWLGISPLPTAFAFAILVAAIIGPIADRGELNPETSTGVVFSFLLGLAFLIVGIMSGSKSAALDLLWGNILTIAKVDIIVLAVAAFVVAATTFLFYKEIQATVFNRRLALAVGIPSTAVLYGILVLAGIAITASIRSVGGLLIFSLILSPAAAAHQITYSMPRMFLLSAIFGVLSCWVGLLLSYLLDIPSGATIVITSSLIFFLAMVFSPKRRSRSWQAEAKGEEQA